MKQHTPLQTLSFLQIPLKWLKIFPTRWCTGGLPWDPKNHFAIGILWEILYFIYLYTNHFQEKIPPSKKKTKQKNTISKWWPMIYFVSHHFHFGKNMKNHFSKGIFQWNLSHDYEYINIAVIKIIKVFFLFFLVGFLWKIIFSRIPPNADLC